MLRPFWARRAHLRRRQRARQAAVEAQVFESRVMLTPDLVPAAFGGWDDSLIYSTTNGTNTTAPVVTTADTVFVDMGWANFGDMTIPGNSFITQLQVDGVPFTNIGTGFNLDPGFGALIEDISIGQLSAGPHTLTMIIDVNGTVAESNEGNNVRQRMFTVIAPTTEDYGDAPDSSQTGFAGSYPTLDASNGARHTLLPGFSLGTNVDTDPDGVPSQLANGDDQAGVPDDEDGVFFFGALTHGSSYLFSVDVTNTAGVTNPYLDAWVDFNRDGDWDDAGEQVFSGAVSAGTNNVNFLVPIGASHGQSYARFRLHDGLTGLTPTGLSPDGEVEDYLVELQAPGDFIDQGPAPVDNGQVENVIPVNRVTGAIHTVLAHPTDPDTLYIGAVNGGIWKTINATATNPLWTPQTDFLESLSIGAMAWDPTDATNNTLIAGTGRYSSFGGRGGTSGQVYRTTDGGATWTVLPDNTNALVGETISGIAVRGNTIVVTSVAGAGGIFRSTDGGATFVVITGGGISAGDNFSDLVVDPTDGTGQRMYAANTGNGGPGGIYRTDDFGATWTLIAGGGAGPIDDLVTDNSNNNIEMAVSPQSGRLFVAVLVQSQPEGLFFTDNGTAVSPTWTQMDVPVLPIGGGIPITGATNASPIVITSVGHGLSTGNFVVIDGVTGNTAANGFWRITRINANTFALDDSTGNGAYAGGGTFTQVTGPNPTPKTVEETGAQGRIHFSIVVDPTNPDIVYVGGDRQVQPSVIGDNTFGGAIFRGNAGIPRNPNIAPSPQWDHATHDIVPLDPQGGTVSGSAPHADSREMVFDADGNLVEVDDGGIFRRTSPIDNTGDWFSLAGNLGTVEFHSTAYDTLTNTIVGGTQDNGTQNQQIPGGPVWELFTGGDGGDVAIDNIVLAGSNQSVRYTSSQFLGGFRRTIFNADGSVNSVSFPNLTVIGGGDPLIPRFYTQIRSNEAAGDRLLIAAANSIYESLDGGSTLTEVGPGIGGGGEAAAYGTAGNVDAAYVGTGDDIAVRTTPGATFTVFDPDPGSGGTIRNVIMNPADFMNAFAVDSNQVFQTLNAGANWADVTGNLMSIAGSFLQSVTYVPGVVDTVVVGAALGVFAAQVTDLTNWVEVGTTLPNVIAYDLDYDVADDVLLVGTLGRGAWMLHAASTALQDLFTVPVPTLNSTAVNGGNMNRSGARSLEFTFSEAVTISAAGALNLFNHTTASFVPLGAASLLNNGTSVITLDLLPLGGLANGRYTIELPAAEVTSVATGMDLAQTSLFQFHVLAGDVTGDELTNASDFVEVDASFDPLAGIPFKPGDSTGDGLTNASDFVDVDANFDPVGAGLGADLAFDFGDAPEAMTSFPTTLANNGAFHFTTGSTLMLGATRDDEADGQPNADATGDGADEDGVVITGGGGALETETAIAVDVTVSEAGILSAWIDYNQDGDWDDAGEKVFDDLAMSAGVNNLLITAPAGAVVGMTFARFRLTVTGGYSYDGAAFSGEVEDYQITINDNLPPPPASFDGEPGLPPLTAVPVMQAEPAGLVPGAVQTEQPVRRVPHHVPFPVGLLALPNLGLEDVVRSTLSSQRKERNARLSLIAGHQQPEQKSSDPQPDSDESSEKSLQNVLRRWGKWYR